MKIITTTNITTGSVSDGLYTIKGDHLRNNVSVEREGQVIRTLDVGGCQPEQVVAALIQDIRGDMSDCSRKLTAKMERNFTASLWRFMVATATQTIIPPKGFRS